MFFFFFNVLLPYLIAGCLLLLSVAAYFMKHVVTCVLERDLSGEHFCPGTCSCVSVLNCTCFMPEKA